MHSSPGALILFFPISLWHDGMLAYLARDEKPNVDASALRLLLGIFAPSLVHVTSALALSAAVVAGLALALFSSSQLRVTTVS